MAGGTAEEEKSDCGAKADGRRVAAGNPSVGAWKRAEWELQCGVVRLCEGERPMKPDTNRL